MCLSIIMSVSSKIETEHTLEEVSTIEETENNQELVSEIPTKDE